MKRLRTYRELSNLVSFEDRFRYLSLSGSVGHSTFGFDRYLNQAFYKSSEWRRTRDYVIIRDEGRDLGVEGYEIHGRLLVHHINPTEVQDILDNEDYLLNPENLITTTHRTHNAIHYGDESLLPSVPKERIPGDTSLW